MLSTLSSGVSASNWRFSNSHSLAFDNRVSPSTCGVSDVARRLSGHGVKREDEQKYAAQGPPKYPRCLLFSHNPITTELNKCSVSYGSELFLLARTDARMCGTDGTTSVLRSSRNEWISPPLRAVAFSNKSQVGVPLVCTENFIRID